MPLSAVSSSWGKEEEWGGGAAWGGSPASGPQRPPAQGDHLPHCLRSWKSPWPRVTGGLAVLCLDSAITCHVGWSQPPPVAKGWQEGKGTAKGWDTQDSRPCLGVTRLLGVARGEGGHWPQDSVCLQGWGWWRLVAAALV